MGDDVRVFLVFFVCFRRIVRGAQAALAMVYTPRARRGITSSCADCDSQCIKHHQQST